MKKIVKMLIKRLVLIMIILVIVLKAVDMHSEGILVRDGWYIIRPMNNFAYQMGAVDPYSKADLNIIFVKTTLGGNQRLYLEYEGDDKYSILYGDANLCLGVADDKILMLQDYADSDAQKWTIERIDHSQGMRITNVASGKSLCYQYYEQWKLMAATVTDYEGNEDSCAMVLVK